MRDTRGDHEFTTLFYGKAAQRLFDPGPHVIQRQRLDLLVGFTNAPGQGADEIRIGDWSSDVCSSDLSIIPQS